MFNQELCSFFNFLKYLVVLIKKKFPLNILLCGLTLSPTPPYENFLATPLESVHFKMELINFKYELMTFIMGLINFEMEIIIFKMIFFNFKLGLINLKPEKVRKHRSTPIYYSQAHIWYMI